MTAREHALAGHLRLCRRILSRAQRIRGYNYGDCLATSLLPPAPHHAAFASRCFRYIDAAGAAKRRGNFRALHSIMLAYFVILLRYFREFYHLKESFSLILSLFDKRC